MSDPPPGVGLTGTESSPLVREGRAEPATSVSRATRDQTDPTRSSRLGGASPISFSRYSPWGRTMELGRSGRTLVAAAAPPGARCEVGGHRQTGGIERASKLPSRVSLFSPNSSCARGAPSQRRRSAERPAIRPTRPARAGWAALRRFRFRDIPLGGERWSSGVRGERWWRPPRRRARAAR